MPRRPHHCELPVETQEDSVPLKAPMACEHQKFTMPDSFDSGHLHEALAHVFAEWDKRQELCDSFALYQTADLLRKAPSCVTASALRWLLRQDLKGTLLIFVRSPRAVHIIPIAEKSFHRLAVLAGTAPDGTAVVVTPMGKGAIPPGLVATVPEILQSAHSFGVVADDTGVMQRAGNKLLDELKAQLTRGAGMRYGVDASPLLRACLCRLLPSSLAPFKEASRVIASFYGKTAIVLDKLAGAPRFLESTRRMALEQAVNSVLGSGALEIPADFEELARDARKTERYFRMSDEQVQGCLENYSVVPTISVCGTCAPGSAPTDAREATLKCIKAGRIGCCYQSDVSLVTGEPQGPQGPQGSQAAEKLVVIAVALTGAKGGQAASLARMLVCGTRDVAEACRSVLDHVVRAHEDSIAAVHAGMPLGDAAAAVRAARAKYAGEAVVDKHTGAPFAVRFCETDFGGIAGALPGSGVGGCSGFAASLQHPVPLELATADPLVVLAPDTPFVLRTVASVALPSFGVAFDCVYADTVLLSQKPVDADRAVASPSHILTAPRHSANSPNEHLRAYFSVRALSAPAAPSSSPPLPGAAPAPRASGRRAEDPGSDSESGEEGPESRGDEESDLNRRKIDRQNRREDIRNLEERQAVLGRLLQSRLQERFANGRQKMRKEAVAQPIPTTYANTLAYPAAISEDAGIIVLKQAGFFFFAINDRCIPFHPTMLFSAKASPSPDAPDLSNVRIQFVAPGNVPARLRDEYDQLRVYADSVYLKEVVFECRSGLADRIVGEIASILTKIKRELQEKQATSHVVMEIDVDGRFSPELRDALLSPEPLRALQPTAHNYAVLSHHTLRQALQIRPAVHRKASKEGGDLQLHENGLRYKITTSTGGSAYIELLFKALKACFFERLRESSHVAIVHFVFRVPTTLRDISNLQAYPGEFDDAVISKHVPNVSFLCNFETGIRLGAGRMSERDEIEQEKQASHLMRSANRIFDAFFATMRASVEAYEAAAHDGCLRGTLFRLCTREHKPLSFSGSYSGNYTFLTYTSKYIACLQPKMQFTVSMDDVDLVVFENVDLYHDLAFHVTFIFKDLRLDPTTIFSVQSKYMEGIQQWLNHWDIKYFSTNNTIKWKDVYASYFNDRTSYKDFLEAGGWLGLFEEDASDEGEEESDGPDSDKFEPDSSDTDDSISESAIVASESGDGTADEDYESELFEFEESEESEQDKGRRRR